MKAIITGATGFIGGSLTRILTAPILLGRSPEKISRLFPQARAVPWLAAGHVPLPADIWEGVDAVINLAGESLVAGRLTPARKESVRQSRIEGTRSLVAAMAAAPRRPSVFICASAIGYYGDRGDAILHEEMPPGDGFLASLCRDWEEEAAKAAALGIRVVSIRIGLVLGKGGGLMTRILPPFRLGLGGRLGNGRQFMSWIHLDDLIGLIGHAIATPTISGPLNAVAPAPVRNRDFTAAMARILRRPALLPVPAFALKLALGDMGREILTSQRVTPAKALATGYSFRFPGLEPALRDVIG